MGEEEPEASGGHPRGDPGKFRLVGCPVCGRSFSEDRVETHAKICAESSSRQRDVYDIVRHRITGTEAGDLFEAGKIRLNPPRANQKKSVLHQKVQQMLSGTVQQPPDPPGGEGHRADNRKEPSGVAYQVLFDKDAPDSPVVRKNSSNPTVSGSRNKLKSYGGHRNRRLKGSKSLQNVVVLPAQSPPEADGAPRHDEAVEMDDDDDEDDFLSASWVSQKSACSDAFDFLFDSRNLDPEKLLESHQEALDIDPKLSSGTGKGTKKQKSGLCTVS